MAIEDNDLDCWGYPVTGQWGTAAGHPPDRIDPVPVRKAIHTVRILVMSRVFDEFLRDTLIDALHAVDVAAR